MSLAQHDSYALIIIYLFIYLFIYFYFNVMRIDCFKLKRYAYIFIHTYISSFDTTTRIYLRFQIHLG